MKLTRDSVVWTVGLLGSVLGSLLIQPPPTAWTYHQWIANLIGALGLISAKLGNSFLKGKDDDQKVTPRP